jgi:hypothetical protein
MAHYLTSDEKYRDLIYDDDCRSYSSGYQFGRTPARRGHGRAALNRVNGYLKSMVEAIANSKLRRMERELELRGIRSDRPNDDWVARKSKPAERS